MATHSSILAWRIPGTEGPSGLLFMGSHRVGHNWSDLAYVYVCVCVCVYILSLLSLPPTLPNPIPLDLHRAPSWISCAIQQLSTSYFFYTWWCIYDSTTLSVHSILFSGCIQRVYIYFPQEHGSPSVADCCKPNPLLWVYLAYPSYALLDTNLCPPSWVSACLFLLHLL